MRVNYINPYIGNNFNARVNNKKIDNASPAYDLINFKAKHFAKEAPKQSFAIKLGQKKAVDAKLRADELQDEALDVLNNRVYEIQAEGHKFYQRAVRELYHPFYSGDRLEEYMERRSKYIYPASVSILSSPVRFDADSTKDGITARLLYNEGDEQIKEEFFSTHQGVLTGYKKASTSPSFVETTLLELNFDDKGELQTYFEDIFVNKNKKVTGKKISFNQGRIKSIEAGKSLNLRTGKETTKGMLYFQNGSLKTVYVDYETKDGKSSFKTKYYAGKDGNLKCVSNSLF